MPIRFSADWRACAEAVKTARERMIFAQEWTINGVRMNGSHSRSMPLLNTRGTVFAGIWTYGGCQDYCRVKLEVDGGIISFPAHFGQGSLVLQVGDALPLNVIAKAAEEMSDIDRDIMITWTWRGDRYCMYYPLAAADLLVVNDVKTKLQEEHMALNIMITVQGVKDFEPVGAGMDDLTAALAFATALATGYKDSGQAVPNWLTDKTRKIKNTIVDRQRDARAADLARLKASYEAKKREAQTLDDLAKQIADLEAQLRPAE